MSGFERILARVGGDALRDYCSSAIEDELKNLKEKMQVCLASVESALEVQDAIQKLDVPLSETNAATFAAIHAEYKKFSDDLGAFISEQKQMQAAHEPEESNRVRTDSVASSVDGNVSGLDDQQKIAKLSSKIQHRLTKKHSSHSWITKSVRDLSTIAAVLKTFAPDKPQRKDLVLVLDHFVSAVLLSPSTKLVELSALDNALANFETSSSDIADFARSSRSLIQDKLAASQQQQQSRSSDTREVLDDRRVKRPRPDPDNIIVKVERQQQQEHAGFVAALDSIHEAYVSDLPWNTRQEEVESYFGVAGPVLSVRMPTMEDGSTVGVAVVRFGSAEGLQAALRMDGYRFQGKVIQVSLPKSN